MAIDKMNVLRIVLAGVWASLLAGCDVPSRVYFTNCTSECLEIIPLRERDLQSEERGAEGDATNGEPERSVVQGMQESGWLPLARYYIIANRTSADFIAMLDICKVWNRHRASKGEEPQSCGLDFDFHVSLYHDRLAMSRLPRLRISDNGKETIDCPFSELNAICGNVAHGKRAYKRLNAERQRDVFGD